MQLNRVKLKQFGDKFVQKLYEPKDPSSLGIVRVMFGLLMMVDVADERGGSSIDIRWGQPRDCRFPLLPNIQPPPLPYIALLYGLMWIGAAGITLGYKFRQSCLMFCLPYWYLFILEKSVWNNHTYLFGLLATLFTFTSAHHYCSIDGHFDKSISNVDVPYWNYFLLKFQIFLLYFYAGLKKLDLEWLEGYSMANLSMHWVFEPFRVILTGKQIDYLIVHIFGFFLDLFLGFLLVWSKTRPFAFLFGSTFHIMNSRLFSIGVFPYVCLATMPLFCEVDWPKKVGNTFLQIIHKNKENTAPSPTKKNKISSYERSKSSQKITTGLILSYCCLQGFLPYSHQITKGYNNWTNGIYGYSWDMMVHSWDTVLTVVKIVDNTNGKELFLDHSVWTFNDRWNKHADMAVQYARCLKENLVKDFNSNTIARRAEYGAKEHDSEVLSKYMSDNISIYVDVWCSLNGRFQQRMFDPSYDLLKARWSPFTRPEWLMPLLNEYNEYREKLLDIQEDVYSWSNFSDVLFIADFPGQKLDNYIVPELRNITLTVLEGEVRYLNELDQTQTILKKNDRILVPNGVFHKVTTISATPSCYMYTYYNRTKELLNEVDRTANTHKSMRSPFPLLEDSEHFIDNIWQMWKLILDAVLNITFDVPMTVRVRSGR